MSRCPHKTVRIDGSLVFVRWHARRMKKQGTELVANHTLKLPMEVIPKSLLKRDLRSGGGLGKVRCDKLPESSSKGMLPAVPFALRSGSANIPAQSTRPKLLSDLVINTDRQTTSSSCARRRRPIWPQSPGNI